MDRNDTEKIQFQRMTETPVSHLICTLATPTILTMLITTFYNMADTFFVARLGTSAAGAGIAGYWFAPEIVALFQVEDPLVVTIGAAAFRAQCISLPLQSTIVLANMLFQSTGKAASAVVISSTLQKTTKKTFLFKIKKHT